MRPIWPLVAFVLGFSGLMWLVADQFLVPGMEAAREATAGQKRQLMAYARLLMVIVLAIVCIAMLAVFRVRRFFFPQASPKRDKTEYPDAWAEAGRRMTAPDDEADGDE